MDLGKSAKRCAELMSIKIQEREHFVFCAVLVYTTALFTTYVFALDDVGTGWNDLDGQTLISLGRKMNKPLLTILGLTIKKFHTCTEWTQWSMCVPSSLSYFGTRSRLRKCRKNSDQDKENRNEKDFQLCELPCPKGYNSTENGFCMKFYDVKMKQAAAEKHCQQDGGHLINIDSEMKHKDVKNYILGIRKLIFLDGRRKNLSSPWRFKYGSQTRYIEWASGQPDDESISLCLVLDDSDSRLLHDINCEIAYTFLCEIPTL